MENWENINVSACIRYCRLKKGLTLKEVAEKAGCSLQYIAQIESGEKNAPPQKCEVIFKSMGIDFKYCKKDERETTNDIVDFIECLYKQNEFLLKQLKDTNNSSEIYTYDFIYEILSRAGIELLLKNNVSEISFIHSCIGERLFHSPGIVGSFYCLLMSIVEQKNKCIQEAENYILKALDLKKENSIITPLLHMQYAAILDNKNLYLDSIHESKVALDFSMNHFYVELSALINTNIGITSFKMHMFEESIQYFDHSIAIAKKIKNNLIVDKNNLNKMRTLYMYGKYDEAISLARIYSKYNDIDSCFILFVNSFFYTKEDYKIYQQIIEKKGYKEVKQVVNYVLSKEFGKEESDLKMLKNISNDFFVYQVLFQIILKNYKNHDLNNIGKLVSDIGINHIILS